MRFDKDNKRIVIKPGKVYWFIGIGWIAVGVFFHWGLRQAKPSDNPQNDEIILLLSLAIPILIGLLFFLYCVLKRVIINERGIASALFLLPRRSYDWNEISYANINPEAKAFPCKVYAGGKLIAKVPRAFVGYEQLLIELKKRELLQEGELLDFAEFVVALDKIKIRDLFKKE